MRAIALALFLFGFWLLLSGHYTAWLIGSGAVTAALVALFSWRAGLTDPEGVPVDRIPAGLWYWPWLVWEIAKSAWAVSLIILNPRLPIAPRLVRIGYPQKHPVGIATYANSITLTPGTLTVEVDRYRQELVVHALTKSGAEDLESGEMGRRVKSFEGGA